MKTGPGSGSSADAQVSPDPPEDALVSHLSAELRQLFERAPALAVVVRGPNHVFDYANPRYLELMGWRDVEGKALREAVPELQGQGFFEILDQVYRTGVPFEGREIAIRLASGPGEPLAEYFFDFVYQPIVGPSGKVEGIFAQGSDVTERVRAERQLRASEARFEDIFSQATVGIAQTDLAGQFVLINDRMCEILGRPREQAMGLTMQEVTHPEDLPGNQVLFQRMLEIGEAFVIEKRYVRPDGSSVWVRNNVALQSDADGRPQYVTAMVVDVTEAKLAEARQQLLINELNHRVKNTLATVQSLAAQAARGGDSNASYATFTDRLIALARAHDVLTKEQWEGAELDAIVEGALRPFDDYVHRRFRITGTSVRLTPRQAVALALALHELATNAVKYGALSNEHGSVAIDWTVHRSREHARLQFRWTEGGGPLVEPPTSEGFGSRLLKRLGGELDGAVSLSYDPPGVICSVTFPLTDSGVF